MIRFLLRCAFLGAALWAAAGAGHAAENPAGTGRPSLIAVMPLEVVDAQPGQGALVRSRLQQRLSVSRQVTTVSLDQVDLAVRDLSQGQVTCSGFECALLVGEDLGVARVVTGRLAQAESGAWELELNVVNVASRKVERTNKAANIPTLDALLDRELPSLAAWLTAALPPGPEPDRVREPDSDSPAPVKAPTRGDTARQPRNAFSVYGGWVNFTGNATTQDGRGVGYSGDGLTLGLSYQLALSGPWVAAVFFENATAGNVSGTLKHLFDTAVLAHYGVELRHWEGDRYLGGTVGYTSTCLHKDTEPLADACFSGLALGAVGGYQWPNGWFVGGSLTYSQPSASQSGDPSVPRLTPGSQIDGWLNGGYRWGWE